MFIPDLHSFTTPIDHSVLQQQIVQMRGFFVAAGHYSTMTTYCYISKLCTSTQRADADSSTALQEWAR